MIVENSLLTGTNIGLMDALHRNWNTPTLSESSVVLIGLLFAIAGLTFRDSFGISFLLAAMGIGLVVAGTVYIAVEGSEIVSLSLALVALVALPLLSYGGFVQWIGGLLLVIVIIGALYSRVSKIVFLGPATGLAFVIVPLLMLVYRSSLK